MIPCESIDVGGVIIRDVSFGRFSHCTLLSPSMTPAALFANHFILKTYSRNCGIGAVWMTHRGNMRAADALCPPGRRWMPRI
jgi:hypothetical protein